MPDPFPVSTPENLDQTPRAFARDRAAVEAVRAEFDREHGCPIKCKCADGSDPPPGVPCTIEHMLELEPIEVDTEGTVTSWAHPYPRAKLKPELAARVESKTPAELDELRATARAAFEAAELDRQRDAGEVQP